MNRLYDFRSTEATIPPIPILQAIQNVSQTTHAIVA